MVNSKIKSLKAGSFIVVLLFIVGAVTRIYGAWSYQYSPNSDYGVISMMAKHMAEGRDFPLIFYGHAYVGTFETAISALFTLLFGFSGFVVSLGTALIGFLILPVVFLWARDAGGTKAGIAALAYSIIGPTAYFHYLASPRGAYATCLLLGTTVLWLSSIIIKKELNGEKTQQIWYLLLGLIAGIGWWSFQLITSALITSALLLLIYLRGRILNSRMILGFIGFLIGSLPFWIWNYQNDWMTFNFLKSFGRTEFWPGLKLFFMDRHLGILDLSKTPLFIQATGIIFYIGAACIAAIALINNVRNRSNNNSRIYLVAVFLFILVSALLFSRSHFATFNTPRYLLPLVPAIAVIIGVATAKLAERVRFGLAWIPLIILIGWQSQIIPKTYSYEKITANNFKETVYLADLLRKNETDVIYTDYYRYWLNYALKEEFVFSDLVRERYIPYGEYADSSNKIAILDNYGDVSSFLSATGGSASSGMIRKLSESSDKVGIMNNYGDVSSFLASVGGSSKHERVGNLSIHFDFKPPKGGIKEIPPSEWAGVKDSAGKDIFRQVTDRYFDTSWQSTLEQEDKEWLEITFKEPVTVSAIRLLSNYRYGYPRPWRIEGRSIKSDKWQKLTPTLPFTYFYWSGPRPYYYDYSGTNFRMESRFSPETLSQLRIYRAKKRADSRWHWKISELQIFGPSSPPESESDYLPSLLQLLTDRKIKHLYGDRWTNNAVYTATKGEVRTERIPVKPAIFKRKRYDFPKPVEFDIKTALVVHNENAQLCRDSLSKRNIVMRETKIGPWVFFDFTSDQWSDEFKSNQGIYWVGLGCLLGKDF